MPRNVSDIVHGRSWIILIIILALSSCGGGTAGTGPGETSGDPLVEGYIVSSSEDPIPGVAITALESGEEDISDLEGRFTLSDPLDGEKLSLSTSRNSFEFRLPRRRQSASGDIRSRISIRIQLNAAEDAVERITVDTDLPGTTSDQ